VHQGRLGELGYAQGGIEAGAEERTEDAGDDTVPLELLTIGALVFPAAAVITATFPVEF
jgi:hypothetical protein